MFSNESLERAAVGLPREWVADRQSTVSDQCGKALGEVLLAEAADPAVRVIVLDVVIGWGAHADPASELAMAIVKAKRLAAKAQRELAVVGFVCGTELDPQVLTKQEDTLRSAGMVLTGNSANAAWLASRWVE